MPDKVDLSAVFGLPPEKAIEYFQAKGYALTWDWKDLWQESQAKAFTVAKVMRADILQDIRGALDDALNNGTTFHEFQKSLTPILQTKGWWGRQLASKVDPTQPDLVDPASGEIKTVQLGSPRRLRTIYQTNLQTAYMAGRYKSMMESTESHPYWQYVAVLDGRTRPAHRAMNGRVFRYDDELWGAMYPPNGFNCRCRVRPMTADAVGREGFTAESSADRLIDHEITLGDGTTTTVKALRIKIDGKDKLFAPDAGWSYNPGRAAFQPELDKYDYKVARQYVHGTLTGPAFTGWYQNMVDEVNHARRGRMSAELMRQTLTHDLVTGQRYPVAVLDDATRDLIGTKTRTVWLSDDTLLKQIINRTGQSIELQDYWRVQGVIEQASLIVRDGALTLVFIKQDGKYYQAAIKATQTGKALFMTSYRETSLDDAKRLMGKGIVLKNEL
jgi:SPP1 gp7 family putative phage head morphogenesis protein